MIFCNETNLEIWENIVASVFWCIMGIGILSQLIHSQRVAMYSHVTGEHSLQNFYCKQRFTLKFTLV